MRRSMLVPDAVCYTPVLERWEGDSQRFLDGPVDPLVSVCFFAV